MRPLETIGCNVRLKFYSQRSSEINDLHPLHNDPSSHYYWSTNDSAVLNSSDAKQNRDITDFILRRTLMILFSRIAIRYDVLDPYSWNDRSGVAHAIVTDSEHSAYRLATLSILLSNMRIIEIMASKNIPLLSFMRCELPSSHVSSWYPKHRRQPWKREGKLF